jgi:hypothetical protein
MENQGLGINSLQRQGQIARKMITQHNHRVLTLQILTVDQENGINQK